MKKFFTLFFILFFLKSSFAATIFSVSNKYGLKDENGNVIIKPQYDKITNLKYTPTKTILIPMKATEENEEKVSCYFKIKSSNKYGIIDNNGKILYKPLYDDVKLNEYGEIVLIKNNEAIIANPIKNSIKKAQKTAASIVGLPVTIVAGVLIPIEMISKIGRKE